jgi:adenylate cyclase
LERAEQELNLHPENSGPAEMGAIALAHLGERDRAREWVARALAIDPDDLNTRYNVAAASSLVGDSDRAIELLEKVMPFVAAEEANRQWSMNDSDFDPTRNDPRFERLLATIGSCKAPTIQ